MRESRRSLALWRPCVLRRARPPGRCSTPLTLRPPFKALRPRAPGGVGLRGAALAGIAAPRVAPDTGFACSAFATPALVAHLRASLGGASAPTRVGPDIAIDYRASSLRCDGRDFPFAPLSPVAQELVVAGGAEHVVARRLAARPATQASLP